MQRILYILLLITLSAQAQFKPFDWFGKRSQSDTYGQTAPFAGWEVTIVAPTDNYEFGTYPERIRMTSGSCCPDRDTIFIWWSDDNSIDTVVITVIDGQWSPTHTFTNAGTYRMVIRESPSADLARIFRVNINESNDLDLGNTSLAGLRTYFPNIKEMTIEGVNIAGEDGLIIDVDNLPLNLEYFRVVKVRDDENPWNVIGGDDMTEYTALETFEILGGSTNSSININKLPVSIESFGIELDDGAYGLLDSLQYNTAMTRSYIYQCGGIYGSFNNFPPSMYYTYLQGDSIITGNLDSATQLLDFHYYNIGEVRGSIESINARAYYPMIYGVGNEITGSWSNVQCDSAGYVYFDGLTNVSYGSGFNWEFWGSSVNYTGAYFIAFTNMNWSASEIDAILCDIDDTAPVPPVGSVIDLRFNSPPTATGLLCIISLQEKGWSVFVDSADVPPYDEDAQGYFERTNVSDTATWWKAGVNTLILALKGYSLYDDISAMWIHATPDGTTALHNVKSSSFTATTTGSPTFTVFEGFTGTGTSYINYNYNLSTHGSPIFTQNDAGFSLYQRTASPTNTAVWFGLGGGSATFIRNNGANIEFGINQASNASHSTALRQANWTVSRVSSTSTFLYANGTSLFNSAIGSQGLPNLNVFGLAINISGSPALHSNCQLSVVSVHGGWDATQVANYNTAIEAFMDYLGKGVQ